MGLKNKMKLTGYIRKLNSNINIPITAHEEDVGYDLSISENICIGMNETVKAKTGLIVKPPDGYHFEVFPRSSLSLKYGLIIPNSPGLIDPNYCGEEDEVCVPLAKIAYSSEDYLPAYHSDINAPAIILQAGTRVAQILLKKTYRFVWDDITGLPFREKTRGGFGSTGV